MSHKTVAMARPRDHPLSLLLFSPLSLLLFRSFSLLLQSGGHQSLLLLVAGLLLTPLLRRPGLLQPGSLHAGRMLSPLSLTLQTNALPLLCFLSLQPFLCFALFLQILLFL